MNEITLDALRRAAEWAAEANAAEAPMPVGGQARRYKQSSWDCGTACCIWGAAHLEAGNGPAQDGPPDAWAGADQLRVAVLGLLRSPHTSPQQMLSLLARANLARADLAGADLAGADLARANLAGANLARADLARADLAGATIWPGWKLVRVG